MERAWSRFNRIARPFEIHGVRDADAYRRWQAGVIDENRSKRPGINWRDPFAASIVGIAPTIVGGRWVVECSACHNYPSYDPQWQLACCGECGAVFDNVMPPDDVVLAELVLMARAEDAQRNWNPATETLARLIQENRQHGDPVGVSDDIAEARLAQVSGAQAEALVEPAPPLRSLVFVGENAVPVIVHDETIVTAEHDATVFAAIEETVQPVDAATKVVLDRLAEQTKGGAA